MMHGSLILTILHVDMRKLLTLSSFIFCTSEPTEFGLLGT